MAYVIKEDVIKLEIARVRELNSGSNPHSMVSFATINSEIHWRQISDREENLGYNLDYRKCKTQLIAIKKEILKSQEQDIFKGI